MVILSDIYIIIIMRSVRLEKQYGDITARLRLQRSQLYVRVRRKSEVLIKSVRSRHLKVLRIQLVMETVLPLLWRCFLIQPRQGRPKAGAPTQRRQLFVSESVSSRPAVTPRIGFIGKKTTVQSLCRQCGKLTLYRRHSAETLIQLCSQRVAEAADHPLPEKARVGSVEASAPATPSARKGAKTRESAAAAIRGEAKKSRTATLRAGKTGQGGSERVSQTS